MRGWSHGQDETVLSGRTEAGIPNHPRHYLHHTFEAAQLEP